MCSTKVIKMMYTKFSASMMVLKVVSKEGHIIPFPLFPASPEDKYRCLQENARYDIYTMVCDASNRTLLPSI